MGEMLAMVGRFSGDRLIAALDELAATGPGDRFGGWGVVWCYGTLLEVARAGRRPPGEPEPRNPDAPGSRSGNLLLREQRSAALRAESEDLSTRAGYELLRDIKPDVAVARLTERAAMPGRSQELQPFLRRELPKPQAFCAPGRLLAPGTLDVGPRISDSRDPVERFFLHVLGALDEADPLASVTAMHERITDEPDQRFALLNTEMLVVSGWQDPVEDRPVFWLGRNDLLRVLSPVQLESLGEMEWEPVPARTVLVFKRRRYEIGQTG